MVEPALKSHISMKVLALSAVTIAGFFLNGSAIFIWWPISYFSHNYWEASRLIGWDTSRDLNALYAWMAWTVIVTGIGCWALFFPYSRGKDSPKSLRRLLKMVCVSYLLMQVGAALVTFLVQYTIYSTGVDLIPARPIHVASIPAIIALVSLIYLTATDKATKGSGKVSVSIP